MEVRLPQNEVYWINSAPKRSSLPALDRKIKADVIIVGGGVAGLVVAKELVGSGFSVVCLEKNRFGAGASGKSGGFLVPDTEKDLDTLIKQYGKKEAAEIWHTSLRGLQYIVKTIEEEEIDCGLRKSGSLYLANESSALARIDTEVNRRHEYNFTGQFINKEDLKNYIGSDRYMGGACFGGTYHLNPFLYCQGILQSLMRNSKFQAFEGTEAINILDNRIVTAKGEVEAQKIVFCSDRFIPPENTMPHVQTSILLSGPLSEKIKRRIFPNPDITMGWDTDLVYQYFRLTDEGRLLLGGGDAFSTYAKSLNLHPEAVFNKLSTYFHDKFPDISVSYQYMWSGMMGIVDDFIGLIGQVSPNYYLNMATAGLSMAAGGALEVSESITKQTNIPKCFSPDRRRLSDSWASRIFGPQATCAFSHVVSAIH